MSAKESGTPPTVPAGSGPGVEPTSSPLYVQVKNHLIHRVLNGEWKPGERLPSEARLAEGYGLSLGTIRKAIEAMVSEGLVARWAGRGTFVNSHRPGSNRPFRFNSIRMDDGQRMAGQPTEYVECRQAQAGARAARGLGIDPDAPVAVIVRVRQLEGNPVLIESTYLADERCPDVHIVLEQDRPNAIYQVLEQQYDILVTRVEEKVRARTATEDESRLLEIQIGAAVLEIERTAFSLGGERVEWRTTVCETGDCYYMNQQKR